MAKNNEDKPEIENRFKEAREYYNQTHDEQLRQKDMAKICYSSEPTISRIEKNETEPARSVIRRYSEKCGVSVEYLLEMTDVKKKENIDIGNRTGLTDEAIETLEYIKNGSDIHSNALAVINAFLSQDDYGSNEAFTLFSSIFNALLSEYAEEQQGIPNTGMHESDIMRYIKQYIDETIRPALRKELAKAYKTPRDY